MDTYRTSMYGGSESTMTSLIDRNSNFDGLYTTSADLRIEGVPEGEIRCEGTVTVAEDASVSAKVSARNVVIAGTAEGEITCSEQFVLRPTGRITGQVSAASIQIEEGAFFEGSFRMGESSSNSFGDRDTGSSVGSDTSADELDSANAATETFVVEGNGAEDTSASVEDEDEDFDLFAFEEEEESVE